MPSQPQSLFTSTVTRLKNGTFWFGVKGKLLNAVLPRPGPGWWQYSMIGPDSLPPSSPTELIDLAIGAISAARDVDLSDISARETGPKTTTTWPGEHYKLLAGFIKVLNPALVVEIGTFTGLSALTMKKFLRREGKLITFDIIPWKQIPDACLKDDDFADGRMTQIIGDLADASTMDKHSSMIAAADILFVDAPKDGVFEPKFVANLSRVRFAKPPLLIFDDIRVWNMLKLWSQLSMPKLDLTSFGHWSGTGLVRWQIS